jgi:hypothetical protein
LVVAFGYGQPWQVRARSKSGVQRRTSAKQVEKKGLNQVKNREEWFVSSSQLDGTPYEETMKLASRPKKLPAAA